MKKEKMKLQQKLFSFRLFVSIMCFIGIIFGGVMTFFFQDMFNAILANVSDIFLSVFLELLPAIKVCTDSSFYAYNHALNRK